MRARSQSDRDVVSPFNADAWRQLPNCQLGAVQLRLYPLVPIYSSYTVDWSFKVD